MFPNINNTLEVRHSILKLETIRGANCDSRLRTTYMTGPHINIDHVMLRVCLRLGIVYRCASSCACQRGHSTNVPVEWLSADFQSRSCACTQVRAAKRMQSSGERYTGICRLPQTSIRCWRSRVGSYQSVMWIADKYACAVVTHHEYCSSTLW